MDTHTHTHTSFCCIAASSFWKLYMYCVIEQDATYTHSRMTGRIWGGGRVTVVTEWNRDHCQACHCHVWSAEHARIWRFSWIIIKRITHGYTLILKIIHVLLHRTRCNMYVFEHDWKNLRGGRGCTGNGHNSGQMSCSNLWLWEKRTSCSLFSRKVQANSEEVGTTGSLQQAAELV